MTNMSNEMTRISRGYVQVGDRRYYAEVYVVTPSMAYQVRIYHKGHTRSWSSCNYRETWRDDPYGSYIYMWFTIDGIPFSCRDLNSNLCGLVLKTNLKIYEESRKWLTPTEKECAHMLAVHSIGVEDVERLLNCDISDLPHAFTEEVAAFREEYRKYCDRL